MSSDQKLLKLHICHFQSELQFWKKSLIRKSNAQLNDFLNEPGLGLRTSVLAALDMCLESKQTRPIN